MQVWRSGSSGRVPSARSHSRWTRLLDGPVHPRQGADVALVDGMGPVEPVADLVLVGLEPLAHGGQRLGVGHLGHGDLEVEARLVDVERRRQVEDGPAVLDGHHPPGGEDPAVADAVDLVEHGHVRVAGPQEVGVQRVGPADLDGAAGGHEGLGGHLAAEDALALLVGVGPAEDVDLDGLEVEEVDQEIRVRRSRPSSCQVVRAGPGGGAGVRHGGDGPTVRPARPPLRWARARDRPSPSGSCGGPPPPPTRSRAATSTTTGGPWSTTPPRAASDVSGDACDSFNRYPEDIALVAGLGLGAYRFSLEWSRIEPEEGEFSRVALDHYRRMAATCHEHGVLPVVTFHHFTHPRWLAAAGTWEALHAPDRFARFCETGHRPPRRPDRHGVHAQRAQRGGHHGVAPRSVPAPGPRTGPAGTWSTPPWSSAHRKGVEAIRSGPGDFPVGMTVSMTDFQLQPGGEAWVERLRRPERGRLPGGHRGRRLRRASRPTPACGSAPTGRSAPRRACGTTQMGYEVWPEALGATIRRATEVTGGLPGLRDRERHRHRRRPAPHRVRDPGPRPGCARCLDDGIDVRGTSTGACSTISSGSSATGRPSAWSEVDRATFERTAQAQRRLLRGRGQGQRPRTRLTGTPDGGVPAGCRGGPRDRRAAPGRRVTASSRGCRLRRPTSARPSPSGSSTCGRSGTPLRPSTSSSTRWCRSSRPSCRSSSCSSSSASSTVGRGRRHRGRQRGRHASPPTG